MDCLYFARELDPAVSDCSVRNNPAQVAKEKVAQVSIPINVSTQSTIKVQSEAADQGSA